MFVRVFVRLSELVCASTETSLPQASLLNMEYRLIGTTGLLVSTLGLGTLTWGKDTSNEEAAALLRLHLENGGNLIDIPGDSLVGDGAGVLGSLLGSQVDRRDLIVCLRSGATVGTSHLEAGPGRGALLDTLDEQLQRLGSDHVDLWIVQGPKRGVDMEQVLSALEVAYRSGRARHVGLDGFSQWDTAYALGLTNRTTAGGAGGLRLDVLSAEFSLLRPEPGLSLLPHTQEHGLGFIGWAPLARGVLTGKYRATLPADSRGATRHLGDTIAPFLADSLANVVDSAIEAAKGYDCPPALVALSWVLGVPGVCATVVGPRTSRQFEQLFSSTPPELPRPLRKVLTEAAWQKASPTRQS